MDLQTDGFYSNRRQSRHNQKESKIAYTMNILPTVAEVLVVSGKRTSFDQFSHIENIALESTALDSDLSYGSTVFEDAGSTKYNSGMGDVKEEQKHAELWDSLKDSRMERTNVFEISDLDIDDGISFTNEDEDSLYDFDDEDMISFSDEIGSLRLKNGPRPGDASILPTSKDKIKLSERQFLVCMKLAENAAKSDASSFTTANILHLVEHI